MGMTYARAGVDIDLKALAVESIVRAVGKTERLRRGRVGESLTGIGHFSGIVRLGGGKALAISTDGVGSKILVAEMLQRYDTIGIDLVAMNANDIICVGAEPLTLVDYLAVEKPDPEVAREIGIGLAKGAKEAGISISGGELAVLPEMIRGIDLAGTIVGIVDIRRMVMGDRIEPGDVVVGLESSGIHSNGLTLARKVLLGAYDIRDEIFDGKSVGEELLTPTKIYVREVLGTLKKADIKGLANITGGGFGNLYRITKHGFLLDNLPEPQAVFQEIQRLGKVSEKEMYRTFNMGVGFCVVVGEEDVDKVVRVCRRHGTEARAIGRVVEERGVRIKGKRFVLGY